jgi:hypothetical protein
MLPPNTSSQRGAVSVYMALLLLFVLTSAALILNAVLAKQIKTANTIVSSEKAFYAATSGLEEGLYKDKLLSKEAVPVPALQEAEKVEGSVSYDKEATYTASAKLFRDVLRTIPCAVSVGHFGQEYRRVIIASDECQPE